MPVKPHTGHPNGDTQTANTKASPAVTKAAVAKLRKQGLTLKAGW